MTCPNCIASSTQKYCQYIISSSTFYSGQCCATGSTTYSCTSSNYTKCSNDDEFDATSAKLLWDFESSPCKTQYDNVTDTSSVYFNQSSSFANGESCAYRGRQEYSYYSGNDGIKVTIRKFYFFIF